MTDQRRFELIANQAREDAQDAAGGWQVTNPYPRGSDASKVWQAAFTRYSLAIEECEVSA
jgi:hypothetical protein